ncbi:MAG: DUF1684 domain-containing protein [Ktedonobacterales bacterium]
MTSDGDTTNAQATDAYIQEIEKSRRQKDEFFRMSRQSPIPAAKRSSGFGGLVYFPPDLAYRVVANVVPFERQEIVPLGSTQGDIRPQLRYGELRFSVGGQQLRLVAFKDVDDPAGEEVFVPFRDATSGKESYGAGRYLETHLETAADGTTTTLLDFNLAYNPWCAYNENYSCTLPPQENMLPVAIRAGERSYH